MNRKQQVITLEPPWWRCENGSEFRSGHNKPSRCPVCGSTNIEMVVEVAEEFREKGKRGTDERYQINQRDRRTDYA